MYLLGISAFYHDAAAALVKDGKIIAAAQEERFSRIKHDAGFPTKAIEYCLAEAGISINEVEAIIYYEKPLLKFERLLESYYANAPKGFSSFIMAMPLWVGSKLYLKKIIRDHLKKGRSKDSAIPKILFTEHHLSHAASAFFPSGYDKAAIITIDGVGEWATTTICKGEANKIEILQQLNFPHSVGLLYSAFTYYLGFKVNSGEYKLMGLAPFGNKDDDETKKFISIIKDKLVSIYEDGSIYVHQQYFDYSAGLRMVKDKAFEKLFGIKKRCSSDTIQQSHCNLAFAIQKVTEEIVLKISAHAKKLSGSENICLAGGVALNCVANGLLHQSGIFENIFVQPASGDAGGALGAALAAYYIYFQKERNATASTDCMQGSYLGPAFCGKEVEEMIRQTNAVSEKSNFGQVVKFAAENLRNGKVIGWVQGRMEYGPRALGNRSILADARDIKMQQKLNLKIKFREGFRPFAPAVKAEDCADYFDLTKPSPYMLLVANVSKKICNPAPENFDELDIKNKLQFNKSKLPAITHVDYSARIQTVHRETNPAFYALLSEFKTITGCPVLINTSFNVRGEPPVCTPMDAYRCFMRTEMDILIIEDFIFEKEKQPIWQETGDWKSITQTD